MQKKKGSFVRVEFDHFFPPSTQVCKEILKINRAARQPFTPINIAAIKQECKLPWQLFILVTGYT